MGAGCRGGLPPARKPRAALTPVVPPPPPSRSVRFAPRMLMPPLSPYPQETHHPHQETLPPPHPKKSPPCPHPHQEISTPPPPPPTRNIPHPTPHPIFPLSLCTACIAHLFCVQICIAHLSPAKESPSASRQPFNRCHIPYWHMTLVSPLSLFWPKMRVVTPVKGSRDNNPIQTPLLFFPLTSCTLSLNEGMPSPWWGVHSRFCG